MPLSMNPSRPTNRFSLGAAAALALLACGQSQKTAGVITETTNGVSVTGAVRDSAGNAYTGAVVVLRSAGPCAGCAADSMALARHTDSTGQYHFDSLPAGVYTILSRPVAGGALARSFTISAGDSGVRVGDSIVRPTAEYSGVAKTPGGTGTIRVNVPGTDLSVLADEAGRFTLPGLPHADLFLRLTASAGGGRLTLPLAAARATDTLTLDTAESVLLEDFDDGDARHLLAPYLGDGGHWYAQADSGITCTPAGVVANPAAAVSAAGAWRNQSLVVTAAFPTPPAKSGLFVVALELSTGLTGHPPAGRWFDFSRMRALTFMAKGSGSLHVAFMTKTVWEKYGGESHFEAVVTLTPEWTEHVILAGDIAPPAGSPAALAGVAWKDAAPFVGELGFFAGENLVLGLDDIRIRGLSPVEFLSPDPKR